MDKQELVEHARQIRKHILKQVYTAQSGHPGGSLSATDLVTALYFQEMDITEANVNSIDRDRFVLSKGHASPLLYAVLCEKGLLDERELLTFRKINSRLQGHPNMKYVAGVDMSTGSLGQGISAAVGMALGNKLAQNHHRVYALLMENVRKVKFGRLPWQLHSISWIIYVSSLIITVCRLMVRWQRL